MTSFESLAGRLSQPTFPLVLCGPILRRVTPSAVTVWLATREPATVVLTVYDSSGSVPQAVLPATGGVAQANTIAVGSNLHIVAVTARGPNGTLKENVTYTYDLGFSFKTSGPKKLFEATSVSSALSEFVYAPHTLPSFVMPPADLEKLRIMHGSCRKPNGGGYDALAILDDLIAASANTPLQRPHQLFMTGDQIYADEVADILLMMLIDAGDVLLGWSEMLPGLPSSPGTPIQAKSLLAGTRHSVIKAAGFTTDDTRSHLMALGDYLSMYLFAWSPVLWPATLPGSDDLPQPPAGGQLLLDFYESDKWAGKADKKWAKQQATIQNYFSTLGKVRRALANIPSYMICDDHEITDDWNMTREFCEKVYGTQLGLRVVQNGLTAYALCQAWGNTPEQFEDEPQPSGRGKAAGRQLLTLLDGTNAALFSNNGAAIQRLVALHDAATLAARAPNPGDPYGPFHDAGAQFLLDGVSMNDHSLNFFYTVEGTSHQVIVTDTRTSRTFTIPGKVQHPQLLTGDGMADQIDGAPSLGNRVQLVIVTTNMPPIPPIRVAEENLPTISPSKIYTSDLYDSWEFPSGSFDSMVLHLSNRLPLDASTPPACSGPVIVLSGDVHTTYASRLQYWANKRYGDSANNPHPATVVFAQLVSSPFKNESDETRGQHRNGYSYIPKDLDFVETHAAKYLLPDETPDGVYGWALPYGNDTSVTVGSTTFVQMEDSTMPVEVSGIKPSVAFSQIWNTSVVAGFRSVINRNTPPDYQYRTEQIYVGASGQAPSPSPTISPVGPAGNAAARAAALATFNTASAAYRNYANTAGKGKAIVGRSNICEITFTWPAGDAKQVHQTARWYETTTADGEVVDTSTVFWARYDVSLALTDTKNYPKLPFPPP